MLSWNGSPDSCIFHLARCPMDRNLPASAKVTGCCAFGAPPILSSPNAPGKARAACHYKFTFMAAPSLLFYVSLEEIRKCSLGRDFLIPFSKIRCGVVLLWRQVHGSSLLPCQIQISFVQKVGIPLGTVLLPWTFKGIYCCKTFLTSSCFGDMGSHPSSNTTRVCYQLSQ